MEIKNNQLTIDIPKGIIKFKPNYITYNNIVNSFAGINTYVYSCNINKLEAIAQLINIAKYYNKDWRPNWSNREPKYYIKFRTSDNTFFVDSNTTINSGYIYFKNLEDAQSVINNPNFREILDTIYKKQIIWNQLLNLLMLYLVY